MSVKIRKGWQAEITPKGFGTTVIFAETLAALDHAVEAHFRSLEEVRERRARAVLSRLAGRERQLYRAVRESQEASE